MSRQGVHGLWDLFRDLWRELNLLTRSCLFSGLVLGLLAGLVYVLRLPPDYGLLGPGNRVVYRTILLPRVVIVLAAAIMGGLVGTTTGVVADMAFGRPDTIDEKKRRRRHNKLKRHEE
jgi:hypothetical protein